MLLVVHGLPDDPFATYWRGYPFFTLGWASDLAQVGAALPGGEALWRRLHGLGAADGPGALFEEDATGVVALTEEPKETRWRYRLSINGKGNSWLPFGGSHTALGAIPAIVHALPRRVAIVGLGSGDTAWAAACRPETESVTVVELSSPQPRILRRLLDVEPFRLPRARARARRAPAAAEPHPGRPAVPPPSEPGPLPARRVRPSGAVRQRVTRSDARAGSRVMRARASGSPRGRRGSSTRSSRRAPSAGCAP